MMDDAYADWWLNPKANYRYIRRGKHYYLLSFIGHICCYKILAEVSERIAKKYKKFSFGIIFYRSTKETFYNKKLLKLHVVYKANLELAYIPTWKMDVI